MSGVPLFTGEEHRLKTSGGNYFQKGFQMKKDRVISVLVVSMMINSFTPYISLADSPKIITPMNTKSDYSIPKGPLLNQKEFKLLSARNIKFKFEGAECVG